MADRRFDPPSGGPLDGMESPGSGPDEPQYEVGGLLGRGGMGEVRVARDTRLGRDVALKTAQHPAAAAQLAREARLTALLEHPNIVPIYGLGHDAQGEPWCAMRLLTGRSLAEAIRESSDRLRLLRHVLDAAGAIAYAHERGVLHRDLKPSNILVGGFGETVVTDWGLACTREEAAQAGPGVGTPGFMSPEQRRGEPLDARADVYGLGGVLFELICGQAPPEQGEAPPVRSLNPQVPPELAAIADRALRPNREERYASARALAADLEAWFEGRRVDAHAYTLRELLTLRLSAYRVPIVIGLVGLFALVLAIGVGWQRNARERERALASERAAKAATEKAERSLADALLAQALTASAADSRMDAEVLAVNALVRRATPQARGVLARFGGRPRLAIVGEARTLPACSRRALSPSGNYLLCGLDETVALYDLADLTRPVAETDQAFPIFRFAGTDSLAVLSDLDGSFWSWRPPEAPRRLAIEPLSASRFGDMELPGSVALIHHSSDVRLDVEAQTATFYQSCGRGISATYLRLLADGGRLVGCSDYRVLRFDADGAMRLAARLSADDGTPFEAAALSGGRTLVGTVRGHLRLFGPDGALLGGVDVGTDAVAQLVQSGEIVGARTGHGDVLVWHAGEGRVLARHQSTLSWIAFRGDPPELRLVGETLEDRQLPSNYRPHRLPMGTGVAAIAIAPSGLLAAAALGDGSVHVLSLLTGERLRSWRWQEGVAKDVAFSADGQLLAVATVKGEQRVLDVATGGVVRGRNDVGAKRVGFLASGWFLEMPYTQSFRWWSGLPGGPPALTHEAAFGELELSHDLRSGVALDEGQGVWRLEDGNPPTLRLLIELPRMIAAAPLGRDSLVLTETALVRLDPAGRVTSELPLSPLPTDVATSADATRFAVGFVNGDIAVYRVGETEPAALLPGHTARVGSLAFTADGQWLLSSGWDGDLRLWSLSELDTEAPTLWSTVTRAWGRSLESALAAIH